MTLHTDLVTVAATALSNYEMDTAERVKAIAELAYAMHAILPFKGRDVERVIHALGMIIERSWLRSSASEGSEEDFAELQAFKDLQARLKALL